MAKKSTTTQVETKETNKADAIRRYHGEHPDAGPSEIAKALTAQGVEVNASRVSTVLRNGATSNKVDVETIKKAAAFVKTAGDSKKALAAIETVGQFIDEIGSSAKAKAALEAYLSVAEVLR